METSTTLESVDSRKPYEPMSLEILYITEDVIRTSSSEDHDQDRGDFF